MNDELTAQMHAVMPYTALIGATAVSVAPDAVVLRLGWDETRCTANGLMHGGALMSLADAAGGYCAFLNLPAGKTNTATIVSSVNLMRAVRSGHVEATARMLHGGRSTLVIDTELRDADGKLVGRVTQTQAVLG
ncbi:PaaI family thioesterase [Pseudonocardia sp. GCM10023141]|uniref:PaaI family thioesterase n=1 Tax=Pseudonocardia sp. GCM10023141 TaxID=3252653 RepID=UPI003614BEDD